MTKKELLHDLLLGMANYAGPKVESWRVGRFPTGSQKINDLATLTFSKKMLVHVRGLLRLYPHVDCMLIARTMIEGCAFTLWMHDEAITKEHIANKAKLTKNAKTWHNHHQAVRHNNLSVIEGEDEEFVRRLRPSVETALRRVGQEFKVKDSKGRTAYRFQWQPMDLRLIFEYVGLGDTYRKQYARFAQWHHWSMSSMVGIVLTNSQSGELFFDEEEDAVLEQALTVAIMALMINFEVCANHFNEEVNGLLPFKQKLLAILSG